MFDKIPKNVQRLIQSFQIIITIIEVRSKRRYKNVMEEW